MGTPHYFLGVELVHVTFGIQLSQHKFIRDILEHFGMTESKPSPTPLSITATLKLHDGTHQPLVPPNIVKSLEPCNT